MLTIAANVTVAHLGETFSSASHRCRISHLVFPFITITVPLLHFNATLPLKSLKRSGCWSFICFAKCVVFPPLVTVLKHLLQIFCLLHPPHRQDIAKQHSYCFLCRLTLVLDLPWLTLACSKLTSRDQALTSWKQQQTYHVTGGLRHVTLLL